MLVMVNREEVCVRTMYLKTILKCRVRVVRHCRRSMQ